MPAKPKGKPAPEDEEETEGEESPEPKKDPTAQLLKQLADQNAAFQKRLEQMEKRLPKPSDAEAEKIEREAAEKKRQDQTKADNDLLLSDMQEVLAAKHGIKAGVTSIEEARTALKLAKANKLGLQTLSEKASGGESQDKKDKLAPIVDVSKLSPPGGT